MTLQAYNVIDFVNTEGGQQDQLLEAYSQDYSINEAYRFVNSIFRIDYLFNEYKECKNQKDLLYLERSVGKVLRPSYGDHVPNIVAQPCQFYPREADLDFANHIK